MPSILPNTGIKSNSVGVLNLIITGMPSILLITYLKWLSKLSFKPYYNWNAFNTEGCASDNKVIKVLNLVISGIPSIHQLLHWLHLDIACSFKPYYNWNAFNTMEGEIIVSTGSKF